MLENATNLTNATVCARVLEGLLCFLSDYWEKLATLLVAFILGVVGLLFTWYKIRTKNLEQIFKTVKIIPVEDGEDTCEYPQHNIDNWSKIRVVKVYLWRHRALSALKKVKSATKRYEKATESTEANIEPIVMGVLDGPWDLDDGAIVPAITYMILNRDDQKHDLQVKKEGDVYVLSGGTYPRLAVASSKEELENLKGVIQSIKDSKMVINLGKTIIKAMHNKKRAENAFKKKLAKIVRKLRFDAGGL